ncbi:MAG TPA: lysophospholipid acyltransferase family protein [Euzebyales bacterium]
MSDWATGDAETTAARVATLRDALTILPRARPALVRLVRTPLRVILWLGLRTGFRLRTEGRRREGPAVIVSNHPHVVDGLVVLVVDPRMRPVARWHRVPLLRSGMWVADCIITTAECHPPRPHRPAFVHGLEHVRAGGRVWIAPEGGWQPEPNLRYPRTGAVRMAAMAGVPLQVLGVVHERHPGPGLATWRPWRRPGILLRWGPVLTMTGDVERDIDRMMTAIAETTGSTWNPPTRDEDPDPSEHRRPGQPAPDR